MAAEVTVSEKPHAQIVFKEAEEVLDLISELRRCLRESKNTGGNYFTSVEDVGGKVTFAVFLPFKKRP